MLELKVEDCESLHRELWNWLADNPSRHKSDWPRWRSNGGDIWDCSAQCFACAALALIRLQQMADNQTPLSGCPVVGCPVVWPHTPAGLWGPKPLCGDRTSIYATYSITAGLDDRARLAREIANLPWKLPEVPDAQKD